MSSSSLLRIAARGSTAMLRAAPLRSAQPLIARPAVVLPGAFVAPAKFSTSVPRRSEHAEETFEEFTAR